MPSKYPVESVLAKSERVVRVWTDNPTFTLGEITLPILQGKITSLREKRDHLETLRMQVTALSSEVNQETSDLSSINTRAKSGVRATYGPNSIQYEQIGGTRPSERKRPTRKNGGGNKSS